jgi:hypothetical protein
VNGDLTRGDEDTLDIGTAANRWGPQVKKEIEKEK